MPGLFKILYVTCRTLIFRKCNSIILTVDRTPCPSSKCIFPWRNRVRLTAHCIRKCHILIFYLYWMVSDAEMLSYEDLCTVF